MDVIRNWVKVYDENKIDRVLAGFDDDAEQGIDESLDKVKCEKKYICAGNHDEGLDRFVEEHPY